MAPAIGRPALDNGSCGSIPGDWVALPPQNIQAAIDKKKPMTMELFSSCLAKCTEWGLYKLFERLLDEYSELSDKYIKAIDEDIKDVALPERTPEEEEESWNRLCERIKNEYGDDLTCE